MSLRRVVFLGPPGAGKGTHATWFAEHDGYLHLSTGDMLRAAVRAGTELGLRAKGFMDAGKLVPDELIIDMLFDSLQGSSQAAASHAECWILDGFPRTVAQAEALDARLEAQGAPLDGVLLFDVPNDELVERLSARLTCTSCGAIYNRRMHLPAEDGICDRCGAEVITRADDQVDAVRQRLEVYATQTAPLIGYYEQRGLLIRIDAAQDVGSVRAEVASILSGD